RARGAGSGGARPSRRGGARPPPPCAPSGREAEPPRRFLRRESAEVAELHHATLARIERREPDEELVERQHVEVGRGYPGGAIVEGHPYRLPGPLVHVPAAGVVHEDAAHHL